MLLTCSSSPQRRVQWVQLALASRNSGLQGKGNTESAVRVRTLDCKFRLGMGWEWLFWQDSTCLEDRRLRMKCLFESTRIRVDNLCMSLSTCRAGMFHLDTWWVIEILGGSNGQSDSQSRCRVEWDQGSRSLMGIADYKWPGLFHCTCNQSGN